MSFRVRLRVSRCLFVPGLGLMWLSWTRISPVETAPGHIDFKGQVAVATETDRAPSPCGSTSDKKATAGTIR